VNSARQLWLNEFTPDSSSMPALCETSGLDVGAVIDTISKGVAQSWQMENRYKAMNEG